MEDELEKKENRTDKKKKKKKKKNNKNGAQDRLEQTAKEQKGLEV